MSEDTDQRPSADIAIAKFIPGLTPVQLTHHSCAVTLATPVGIVVGT